MSPVRYSGRSRTGASSFVLLLLCWVFAPPSLSWAARPEGVVMIKRTISSRRAMCNDGTDAMLYLDEGCGRQQDGWVVHFAGGGGCTDEQQCRERNRNMETNILTSSRLLPGSITGRDILSSDEIENPQFHCYCHAFVPYCTSDYWLASAPSSGPGNFSFLGATVFLGAVEYLIQEGMENASEVVIVGSSAGAIGVLNSIPWLSGVLPHANLSVIIDSGWFVNFNNTYQAIASADIVQKFINSSTSPLCLLVDSNGVPCCLIPTCILFSQNLTISSPPPILVITSMYDSFLLSFALRRVTETLDEEGVVSATKAIYTVYAYGSALQTAAASVHAALPHVSFFMPSCTQHIFLASSSLWEQGGLLESTSVNALIVQRYFEAFNPIYPGLWKSVQIEGVSIRSVIHLWYNSTSGGSLFIEDSCSGLFCTPYCKNLVKLLSRYSGYNVWWEWTTLVLGLLVVYGPILPKILLYLQQKWLLWQQKKYALVMTTKKLCRQGTIFTSISCMDLSYKVANSKLKAVKDALGTWKATGCVHGTTVEDMNEQEGQIEGFADAKAMSDAKVTDATVVSVDPNRIIHDVNFYINPGELVAIMGPTGSGKTTLLDVLMGQRSSSSVEGDVFVQGIPLPLMKDWFKRNSAYVRQLACTYYEELTVRENMLLSANMQMPPGTKVVQVLERVEQVINETGLANVANYRVGGATGLGLSGGQKKRLSIALQLIKMPSVLFLDEPTTGLDAATSKDILTVLNRLTQMGCSVLLTIHQPRIEIFHMFHKIVLFTEGQVAYFGSPFKAISYFTEKLQERGMHFKVNAMSSPADVLLDMLTNKEHQRALLQSYQEGEEPHEVKNAILMAQQSIAHAPTASHVQNPGFWKRFLSLETRASLRQTRVQVGYVPVVFAALAFLLTTAYFPADAAGKVVAVICLLSCCPSLLMSSIVYGLLLKPVQIFWLEHADGICKAHDLVLQVFLRMAALSAIPLTVCIVVIAVFLFQPEGYNPTVIATVVVFFLLSNLAWVTIFMLITLSFPSLTHRICPLVAALGSFFCGFIIPIDQLNWYYQWILYIDPSFYAFSGTTVTVLRSKEFCTTDEGIECFPESSASFITLFGIDHVVPTYHLAILVAFVVLLLLASILTLHLKVEFASLMEKARRRAQLLRRHKSHTTSVDVPNVQSQASFNKTSTLLDSKKSRHKIVHDFEVWGAKDKAEGEDKKLERREDHHVQSSVSMDCESLHSHQHEVVDMEQSEEHRVAELVQVLLKRRVRMEQELAQGMHLLHLMRMNPPGPGDWMHADAESNLVSQDNVGCQYQTVEHHKPTSTNGKRCSHNSAAHCTHHIKSPAVPDLHLARADSQRVEGMNLMSPAYSDSPLLPPAAGNCKRHGESSKSTKDKGEASQQQFVFSLPGEAISSQEMNSASTSPLQQSVNSSASSMEHAHSL